MVITVQKLRGNDFLPDFSSMILEFFISRFESINYKCKRKKNNDALNRD
jgi:hypothetical protein